MGGASVIPLQCLRNGEWAEVLDLSGEPACVHRMQELGLRPGTVIRMLQAGNTCLVELDSGRLSIRTENCVEVLVEPRSALAATVGKVA